MIPRRSGRRSSTTVRAAMTQARIGAKDVAGIGITNQRETMVIWDRQTGKPIHNAIVWQDRRTADYCEALRRNGHEPDIARKTGLAARSVFFRHQDRLVARSRRRRSRSGGGRQARLRHYRQLSALAAHRRQGASDRRHQCRAHAAVRYREGNLGRRPLPSFQRAAPRCFRMCATARACLAKRTPTCSAARSAFVAYRRRPAGGHDRAGLFRRRA